MAELCTYCDEIRMISSFDVVLLYLAMVKFRSYGEPPLLVLALAAAWSKLPVKLLTFNN